MLNCILKKGILFKVFLEKNRQMKIMSFFSVLISMSKYIYMYTCKKKDDVKMQIDWIQRCINMNLNVFTSGIL